MKGNPHIKYTEAASESPSASSRPMAEKLHPRVAAMLRQVLFDTRQQMETAKDRVKQGQDFLKDAEERLASLEDDERIILETLGEA